MKDIIFPAAAYLIGAVPFGFLIGKLNGKDIRLEGSCNIGATNVTRVVGKWWGKLCFLLDFCKGLLPVLAALKWGESSVAPVLAGAGTIAGHIFPVYLKFKGGKGVATAGGVICALSPPGFIIGFALWGAVFFISGYVSLASIIAAAALPFAVLALNLTGRVKEVGLPSLIFIFIAAALAIAKHRSNIVRLLNGTENSFRKNKDKKS